MNPSTVTPSFQHPYPPERPLAPLTDKMELSAGLSDQRGTHMSPTCKAGFTTEPHSGQLGPEIKAKCHSQISSVPEQNSMFTAEEKYCSDPSYTSTGTSSAAEMFKSSGNQFSDCRSSQERSTAGLFSSDVDSDFFSSIEPQSLNTFMAPPINPQAVPPVHKSVSAPSTGLIHVLQPSEQHQGMFDSRPHTFLTAISGELPLSSSHPSLILEHSSGHHSLGQPSSLPLSEQTLVSCDPPSGRPSLPSLPSGQPLLSPHDQSPVDVGTTRPDSQALSSLGSVNSLVLTNADSCISSPQSRPSSNADSYSHAKMPIFSCEPFSSVVNYQQTNANPEYRSTQKRPLTNLEGGMDPDRKTLERIHSEKKSPSHSTSGDDSGAQASCTTNEGDRGTLAYGGGVSTGEVSDVVSSTSSLNHSLSSLLDCQEDFTTRVSPIRLVAPAPFLPTVGSPTSLTREVQLDQLSLLPPAPLPLTASTSGHTSTGSHKTSTYMNREVYLPVSNSAVSMSHSMSGCDGTERLLAEASADEYVDSEVAVGTVSLNSPVVEPTGLGDHPEYQISSLSAETLPGSTGKVSLNGWEIVDDVTEQGGLDPPATYAPPPPQGSACDTPPQVQGMLTAEGLPMASKSLSVVGVALEPAATPGGNLVVFESARLLLQSPGDILHSPEDKNPSIDAVPVEQITQLTATHQQCSSSKVLPLTCSSMVHSREEVFSTAGSNVTTTTSSTSNLTTFTTHTSTVSSFLEQPTEQDRTLVGMHVLLPGHDDLASVPVSSANSVSTLHPPLQSLEIDQVTTSNKDKAVSPIQVTDTVSLSVEQPVGAISLAPNLQGISSIPYVEQPGIKSSDPLSQGIECVQHPSMSVHQPSGSIGAEMPSAVPQLPPSRPLAQQPLPPSQQPLPPQTLPPQSSHTQQVQLLPSSNPQQPLPHQLLPPQQPRLPPSHPQQPQFLPNLLHFPPPQPMEPPSLQPQQALPQPKLPLEELKAMTSANQLHGGTIPTLAATSSALSAASLPSQKVASVFPVIPNVVSIGQRQTSVQSETKLHERNIDTAPSTRVAALRRKDSPESSFKPVSATAGNLTGNPPESLDVSLEESDKGDFECYSGTSEPPRPHYSDYHDRGRFQSRYGGEYDPYYYDGFQPGYQDPYRPRSHLYGYPDPPHGHRESQSWYHPSGRAGHNSYGGYSDPYHHRDHYPYDPYRYEGYNSQGGPPLGYHTPTDSHYGHPPPYDRDISYRHYARPPHGYPYPEERYIQDPEVYGTSAIGSNTTAEPSMIYGRTNEQNFEESHVFDSPNTQIPAHPHLPPLDSTYLEPAEDTGQSQPLGVDKRGYVQQENQWDYPDGDGDYYLYPNDTYYSDTEGMHQREKPQTTTPPPPAPDTPEIFSCPHVRTTLCFGGNVVTVLPSNVGAGEPAIVEIMSIRDLLVDEESREFVEAIEDFPGPFIPRDTPKNVVVNFASRKAEACRGEEVSAITPSTEDVPAEVYQDEMLLWGVLVLLCQQNGVVMPSDIAELLVKDCPLTFMSSPHFGSQEQQECLDTLRNFLLSGRKKDALEFSCSKFLWGHALMLASRMDDQSRTYVVNRFTASLLTTDPLNTFYALFIGRTPSIVKPEGLSRSGDWRPHLSMILANKSTKLDTASIISLGDSLMGRKQLNAAHLCYYLADVHFGSYGDLDTRYSLLGVDHSELKTGTYPRPRDLRKMEVFEYALCLTKQDFAMPSFQVFKLLHMLKLVEYGFLKVALKYCEQVGLTVMKQLHNYVPIFLKLLLSLSVRLHHFTSEFGYVETELPSWLYHLEQSVDALMSTGYTLNMLSPSPAFSSVSQTYSAHGVQPQLVIGLQQDAAHLTVPHVVALSSIKGIHPPSSSVKEGMDDEEFYHSDERSNEPRTDGGIYYGQHQPVSEGAGDVEGMNSYGQQQPVSEGAGDVEGMNSYGQQQPVFEGAGGVGGMNSYGQQQPVSEGAGGVGGMNSNVQQQPVEGAGGMNSYGQQKPVSEEAHGVGGMINDGAGGVGGMISDGASGVGGMNSYGQRQPASGYSGFQQESVQDYGMRNGTHVLEGNSTQSQVEVDYAAQAQGNYTSPRVDFPTSTTDYFMPPQAGYSTSSQDGGTQPSLAPAHSTGREEVVTEGKNSLEETTNKPDAGSSKEAKFEKEAKATGGGWGTWFKSFVPNKKNQAHLPDDKNPTIVYDKVKKKWIDLNANAEEEENLAPPPSDAELNRPPQQLPPTAGDGKPPATNFTVVEGPPGGLSNKYSRQSARMRHSGARSKYVDILNPGVSDSSSPSPALPPAGLGVSLGTNQPFTGNLFVPQAIPDATVQPTPALQSDQQQKPDQQYSHLQHLSNQVAGQVDTRLSGMQMQQGVTGVQQPAAVQQPGPLLTQGIYQQQQQHILQPGGRGQNLSLRQQNTLMLQENHGSAHSMVEHGQNPGDQHEHDILASVQQKASAVDQQEVTSQQVPDPQPQFFNPSAFAQVGISGSSDKQEDSMSTVSLMSESSQEVSRYMNRVAVTTSTGYSRLKHGIKGTGGYPSVVGGVARLNPGSVPGQTGSLS